MKKNERKVWLPQKQYDSKNWEQKKKEEAKVILSPKAEEMKRRVGYVF